MSLDTHEREITMSETKRRDFLKGTALTMAGAGFLATTASNASARIEEPKVRRIIAINGSHRAGMTTAAGLKLVLESAKETDSSLETELIELASIDFNQAVVGGDQPNDAITPVLDKIASPECVGLIIGSPVYFMLPTGRCVSFISRLQPLRRAGVFRNMVFGAVATGASRNGGQEAVLQALFSSALPFQVLVAVDGRWGASFWNQGDSIEQDNLGQDAAKFLGIRMAELIGMAWK
jgi:multimeric flavodoxin WrbA